LFDRRSPLIVGAGPLGMALAVVAWLLFGAHASALGSLDQLQSRLRQAPSAMLVSSTGSSAQARAVATPLFGPTSGPGAPTEAAVRLDGLAITPGRKAALISINGKPADWLSLGESRDGVTLTQVTATKVTVDTAMGSKDIGLYAAAPVASGPASPAPSGPSR
jgi:hypothetical protein